MLKYLKKISQLKKILKGDIGILTGRRKRFKSPYKELKDSEKALRTRQKKKVAEGPPAILLIASLSSFSFLLLAPFFLSYARFLINSKYISLVTVV